MGYLNDLFFHTSIRQIPLLMKITQKILVLTLLLFFVSNVESQILASQEMLDQYELTKNKFFTPDLNATIAFPYEKFVAIEEIDVAGMSKKIQKQLHETYDRHVEAVALFETGLKEVSFPISVEWVFLSYQDHANNYVSPKNTGADFKQIEGGRNLLNYDFINDYRYVIVFIFYQQYSVDSPGSAEARLRTTYTNPTYYLLDNETMLKYKLGVSNYTQIQLAPAKSTRFLINKLNALFENTPN